MKRFVKAAFLGLLLLSQESLAWALEDEVFQFFEEEAKVITASRRPQPVKEAPVAVEVITAEEVRASGGANLWDLMRFKAGMDVLDGRSSDGNRAVVSVRGFPQAFVNNLQVLLDGRSVYSAYSGGVFWEQLPVQLEDIERIEIVRGPNAALYGSNAGLGVINILTKKPTLKSEGLAYGMGGNRETYRSGAAYQNVGNQGGYRLSYSYWTEDGFPNVPNVSSPSKDDLSSHKANFRGFWSPASGTELELLTGASWDKVGVAFGRDGRFRQGFGMLRLSQNLTAGSSVEVMASRNDLDQEIKPNFNGVLDVQYSQFDLEVLHRLTWWNDRLKTTWGGSYRESTAKSDLV